MQHTATPWLRAVLLTLLTGCGPTGEPFCVASTDGSESASVLQDDDAALSLVECCIRGARVQSGFDLGTAIFEVRGVDNHGRCDLRYGREVELSGFDWTRCRFPGPVQIPERERFATGEGVPPDFSALDACE